MKIALKRYEDLSDLEKLALQDFSYSRIDTYLSCPSKYFYSYVIKEPRQFNPPAVLGNIVHDVLENVLENDKQLSLEELQGEYDAQIPKWDPEHQIPQDLLDVGKVILDEFYDAYSDKQFSIYDKELQFDFIIGTYRIRGFIDRVDVQGDRVTIIDYKTGKWEVAAKTVHENLQLGIYAIAAAELFPDKEIYAELYYLRSGKHKGHLYTKDELETIKEKLIQQINVIINDKQFSATKNTRACSYCDHAKSRACATGVYRNMNRHY